jgi:7-cyano-7-deazaguanine synthase
VEPYTYGWLTKGGELIGNTLLEPKFHNLRALIICSGGLDSSVAAWMHHKLDFHVDLLHLNYECRAKEQERNAVIKLAGALHNDGNPGGGYHILETDFFAKHASSALTDHSQPIAQGVAGAEYAHEWVPARNTVMMALAVAFAEKHGYDVIVLGSNQEESCGGYPDNEQEFVNKWRELIPFAVKPYTEMAIGDPLGGAMKHEIVTIGSQYGAPMELSWSCYEGGDQHCGTCGPCTMRRRAFRMAGVPDKTEYLREAL